MGGTERRVPLKQDRISTRRLGALLWAGLMAPAAELLPAVTLPLAGRAAWLSALAALPVVLLLLLRHRRMSSSDL